MSKYEKIASEKEDIFIKYEDTDLYGASCELRIDELIEDFKELIKEQIPKEDQTNMRIAIKKLWKEKINQWR